MKSNHKNREFRYLCFFSLIPAAVFTGWKLTGVIEWSWWWVLSPVWILFGGTVLFSAIAGIAMILSGITK